jgi:hypothetical protein
MWLVVLFADLKMHGSTNHTLKHTYKIISRDLGVNFWLACLSVYLSGKLSLRNSATLIKIGPLDRFV